MPMLPANLQKALETVLIAAFTAEFADEIAANPKAAASHKKMASVISKIAGPIVKMLLTEAQVAPGIAIVGAGGGVPGPVSGATSAPGKLL